MDKEELIKLFQRFESSLIDAWVYDTKLDCQESYISQSQYKKSEEKHNSAKDLRIELLEAIGGLYA